MIDVGSWFLDVASAVAENGQLGPPRAIIKRLRQVEDEIGWERMKQAVGDLGLADALADMDKVACLANDHPDLPRLLGEERGRTALDEWCQQHRAQVEGIKGVFLSLLRVPPPETKVVVRPAQARNPAWQKLWSETLSEVTRTGDEG